MAFLDNHRLLPRHQSAYRRRHSTETAIQKIVSDRRLARDRGHVSVAYLKGLCSVTFSFCSTVLTSQTLLRACMALLLVHWRRWHSALPSLPDSGLRSKARPLTACIAQLDECMTSTRLNLIRRNLSGSVHGSNLWISVYGADCSEGLQHHNIALRHVPWRWSRRWADVCVTREARLSSLALYHHRQLWSIRSALSADNAKMLVYALVASRVDYCNNILHQDAAVHLRPLQSVLNAAARLVVKKRKFDSITPTLRDDLHWLLVRLRLDF